MIQHQIPDLYKSFFPKELLTARIEETKATCSSCNWKAYQPDLKCCTFEPYLPNYLVGALLGSASTAPSAKAALQKKMAARQYSLPIGMTASVKYQVRFNQRKPEDFGNQKDLLCPYYSRDTQNCGIWKYRGAVCTTFFCQSNYGQKGQQFWAQLNDYLTYVEMALMEDVLVHLDFSPRQLSDCLEYLNRHEGSALELKLQSLPIEKARKLWNGYFDEQEEFFRKTYQMVKDFDKKRYKEAMGEMGSEIEDKLLNSLRKIT
jgi:Fe-S-cluster containining protein